MDSKEFIKYIKEYKGYQYKGSHELKEIEESIMKRMVNWLCPRPKDTVLSKDYEKEEREVEKEEAFEAFKEIKNNINNYHIPELIIYFLSEAHNDWILAHKDELLKQPIKDAEKYVPLELLNIKEFEKYLSVATPIFNAVDINFDNQEIRREFDRKQLLFMIERKIYTNNDLKEKIRYTEIINPEILEVNISKPKRIQEIFDNEDISMEVADKVNENIDLNIANKIKKVFYSNGDDVGFLIADSGKDRIDVYKFADNISQKKIGFKKLAYPRPNKPITKDLYELARFGGIIFAKNVKKSDYKYFNYFKYEKRVPTFLPENECNEEQKKLIQKRKSKIQKYTDRYEKSRKGDIPGVITLVHLKEQLMPFQNHVTTKLDDNMRNNIEIIQIPITRKELIKMKILPEEVGWEKEKKAKIASNSKVYLATPDKLDEFIVRQNVKNSNGENVFKNFLVELAKNGNLDDKKISNYKENNDGKSNKPEKSLDDENVK